jgi:Rrf2 family protein
MRLELTRRSEYAIRACLHLAASDRYLSRPAVARATDVPERFLGRILHDLVGSGIVEARIGRSGGYRLRRPSEAVTVGELIAAIEGPSRSTRCLVHGGVCDAARACPIHHVWTRAQNGLIGVLASTSLADLAGSRATPIDRPVDDSNLERTA